MRLRRANKKREKKNNNNLNFMDRVNIFTRASLCVDRD